MTTGEEATDPGDTDPGDTEPGDTDPGGAGPGRVRRGRREVLRDGLLLAVGTLTAVPVPAPRTVDRPAAGLAMAVAPLVGVVPGAAGALAAWTALALGLQPAVAASLAVAAIALTSRGLHLDGLADTADGFAAGYQRERALEVMRRGNTGPAGAAAVVLVVVLQVATLTTALDRWGPQSVLVAAVAGRVALPVLSMRGVPSARSEGLGATVAATVPRWAAGVSALTAALLAAVALGACGEQAWRAPLAVALATLMAAAVAARAQRRLGGVTGDVLGAGVELATTVALLALVASPG